MSGRTNRAGGINLIFPSVDGILKMSKTKKVKIGPQTEDYGVPKRGGVKQ
jgi:hypothetical protein